MQALTFAGPDSLRVESVPDPRIEAPTEAVVRVDLCAVCGSDLHVYRGRETGLDVGTVMGHELVGHVVEVGAEVRRFAVGDAVVSPFSTSCGRCFFCERGLTSRCERGALLGWVAGGAGLHGAQAELVRVTWADETLVGLPDGVAPDLALLAGDVLSTGMYCAEAAGVGPSSIVAVVGCGPVGLMSVVACRERGAREVWALDALPERLALAAGFGARTLDLAAEDPVARLREATEGRGVDAVLEAVGSAAATRTAVDVVRPGGVISAVGVHTETRFAFSPVEAYDKNLTYTAGRCPARRLAEPALALIRSKRYDLSAILSHRLPLSDGVHGYELFDRKVDGCTKVLLEP